MMQQSVSTQVRTAVLSDELVMPFMSMTLLVEGCLSETECECVAKVNTTKSGYPKFRGVRMTLNRTSRLGPNQLRISINIYVQLYLLK